MGRVLQIRVMATTPYPEEIERTWPALYALAWPDPLPPSQAPLTPRDLLELVSTLDDQLRFGLKDRHVRDALQSDLDRALSIKAKLEDALANWKAGEAHSLSTQLEDALDVLEQKAQDAAASGQK